FRRNDKVDAADKIAADARLLEIDGESPISDRGGFLQGPLGDGVQHARGRHIGRRVGGRASCEQSVDIDPARGEFAFGLWLHAEVKRELALHHLRAALGVNGNLEDRKLGAVRRGVELALELEGGKMRFGAGTLLAWPQRAVVLRAA